MLEREAESLRSAGEPDVHRAAHRATVTRRSLGTRWVRTERKRLLGAIFEEIVVALNGAYDLVPREGWRPYLKAALDRPRGPVESNAANSARRELRA